MRIQFCGADRTVTGSCHFIEVGGLKLLLDLGMFQGRRDESRRLNGYLPAELPNIDAVILSHGHLDHCGRLPILARHGWRGSIYCTPATVGVARIVLEDSAGIQEEDARYLNKRTRGVNEPEVEPMYTIADARQILGQFVKVDYRQRVALNDRVGFLFLDAGHILGSASVLIDYIDHRGEKKLLYFTGDVGRYDTPILNDPHSVDRPVDVLITESTYGDRIHAPMAGVEEQFLDAVKWCIERNGRLIIPSFAVGRTQTVLWYIQKFISEGRIPQIPIYVDSPMGVQVSEVYRMYDDNYDEQTRQMLGDKNLFGLTRVHFTASIKESKAINRHDGSCVIIASSPTCEFGRVLHHIEQSIERSNDMVLFVGWVPENTLGRRLQTRQPRVRIYDRWYEVKCEVRTAHGLSAHADAEELLRFTRPAIGPGTRVFVVHGEDRSADAFAHRLVENGAASVTVPAMQTVVIE